jgi:hypothetical protein
MKCHLCGKDLEPDHIKVWELGNRYCTGYGCRNKSCSTPSNVNTDSSVFMHVVLPEGEVNYYLLRFPHRDKWYQVTSMLFQVGGETVFSASNPPAYEPLIKLPRFIPLDWYKPLDVQVDALREKMKTLLYFL